MRRTIFSRLCAFLAGLILMLPLAYAPCVTVLAQETTVSEQSTEDSDTAQTITLTKGQKIVGFLVIFTVVFVVTAVVSTRPARQRLKEQREAMTPHEDTPPEKDGETENAPSSSQE